MIESIIMTDGHLPDFAGKPVLANCINCAHVEDASDGPEYGGSFYICSKEGKEHMSNLKSWPFKTAQKCCDLNISHTINWELEKGN